MARRSCYAFHIQHWSDGRRSRSEHEGRQYCGQRFVFSHVDLLRGHSPIRGDADSIAEDCRYSTADTGDQIVESSLMAGGEAGREAVLPLKGFYDQLENILSSRLNTSAIRLRLPVSCIW